jgi:RNA-directed DNA polymerase
MNSTRAGHRAGQACPRGLHVYEKAAKQRKQERFTALLHHVTIDLLKDAYSWLKRETAPGVDGRTWQSYKQNVEVNLAELHSRLGPFPWLQVFRTAFSYENKALEHG